MSTLFKAAKVSWLKLWMMKSNLDMEGSEDTKRLIEGSTDYTNDFQTLVGIRITWKGPDSEIIIQ